MRRQTLTALAALAVVTAVSVVGATGALAGSTPHDGTGANYTVALPNEQDHYPGQDGASIWHLAAAGTAFEGTSSPDGLETIKFIVISNQDIDFSSCTTENTRAFGVDRGNDDSGTTTDDPLLRHRENSQFNKHSIVVEFYGEDAAFGSSTYYNASDQIVAVQEGCYTMPSEPGWYQINAQINGTGYNGNHIDEDGIKSHYFYICECSSEQEARDKLGPPPSEAGSGGGGDGGSTPQPTATPAPKGTATPSQGTATPAQGTATPAQGTPSQGTATPGQDPQTATPGDKSGQGTPAPTATGPGGNGTQAPTGNGNNGTGPGNGNNDGGGNGPQQTNADGGPLTPTAGAGPGFGALVALLGLLAATLLATRE